LVLAGVFRELVGKYFGLGQKIWSLGEVFGGDLGQFFGNAQEFWA
jgi:hypothetical protein